MIAVSTLLEKLRRTLKDEDKNSFTDDELIDYIEAGVAFLRRAIIAANPEYIAVQVDAGVVPAGDNEVELESSCYVLDVRVNGKKVRRENISSIEDTGAKGDIKKYCLLNGNRLLFFPVPGASYSYSVIGIPDAPRLSAEACTPFGSDMDTLIFEYAVIRAGMGDSFQMSQEMEVMGMIMQQVTKLVTLYNQCEEGTVSGYY